VKIKNAVVVGALALALGNAQAALIDRGGGLIYDDALNVTWLQDANYAKTSGYDADGRMNWSAAITWAANLSYGGYSDWRLPTVAPVKPTGFDYTNWASDGLHDLSYNITSKNSELSFLFYVELGNAGYMSIGNVIQSVYGLVNSGPFINFESGRYWSGTEGRHDPVAENAWAFDTGDGLQQAPNKGQLLYALAVRDGDVATPIPEPETYAMMLAGLGLLGFMRRKKKAEAA
jgi:hypothetical protein